MDDIQIRIAAKVNDDLYRKMLEKINILDTERIVNEGDISNESDYWTIYYHKETKYVGLYNVVHCSCYGTEDGQPDDFSEEKLTIVDTIEGFYEKCVNNSLDIEYQDQVIQSYIKWFDENFPLNNKVLTLDCGDTGLTKIENLPTTLKYLQYYSNKIIKIENLPETLTLINFYNNLIIKIENLPPNLTFLNISENKIIKIENLPETLS